MARKPCRECGGSGRAKVQVHASGCWVADPSVIYFDGPRCDCDPTKCSACGGSGGRERHRDKLAREVMES